MTTNTKPRDLRALVRDSKTMRDGEWVSLGQEWLNIQVLVRGLGHDYNDNINGRQRALAKAYPGREVPSEMAAAEMTEALIECALVDAKAPEDVLLDGQPVTLETFSKLLREPGATELVNAVILATNRVGRAKTETVKAAKGN